MLSFCTDVSALSYLLRPPTAVSATKVPKRPTPRISLKYHHAPAPTRGVVYFVHPASYIGLIADTILPAVDEPGLAARESRIHVRDAAARSQ